MTSARTVRVRGVVQGVGFRPFVFRLARANCARRMGAERAGWRGYSSGRRRSRARCFPLATSNAKHHRPRGSQRLRSDAAEQAGLTDFTIRESQAAGRPSVRISPDLPVCDDCLAELFDPSDPRYLYPYINCTNCGPRYTVIESLPYDRAEHHHAALADGRLSARLNITIRWTAAFMRNPSLAPQCGPHYLLEAGCEMPAQLRRRLKLLRDGQIVAIKGIGGYHLACDARNALAVQVAARTEISQRETVRGDGARHRHRARGSAELSAEAEALLTSAARPIVLAPAKMELPGRGAGQCRIGRACCPTLRCIICCSRRARRKCW